MAEPNPVQKRTLSSLFDLITRIDLRLDPKTQDRILALYYALQNPERWTPEKLLEEKEHWPLDNESHKVNREVQTLLQAYYAEQCNRSQQVIIGSDTQTKNFILTTQENLESGTYIVGVQGVGKSSLLLDMLLQQMEMGESVIVLDPHGDLVRDTIARMPTSRIQDTYLLDLKEARKWPFGLNIFALPADKLNSPEARDSVRNQVMHAFEKLWPETRTGLYFSNVLRPVIATLIENQELTLAHVPRLFYNDTFREHYTKHLKNMEAQDFWGEYAVWSRSKRERQIDPLLDRIKKLLSDDVIRFTLCQKQSKLDLADLIKQRKNILLRLPLRDPAYEYAAPIIGTFFMTLLQAAIFSFGNLPHAKRPSCTLVIDEFQNFVTEDNERFFSEGRKYRVKQILAHQYMSQLDRDGLTTMKQAATSAYTIIAFRTNKEDSAALAPLFSGLQRKPTDIYIDVLPRLEKHPNAIVKEFYWQTVRHLQLAEKLKEDKRTDTLPSYNFGFGIVRFQLQTVTALLSELNTLCYYAQKEERIREQDKEQFVEHYGKLTGIVQTKMVDDDAVLSQIRRKEAEIDDLEAQKAGRLEWYEQAYQPNLDELYRKADAYYYQENQSIDRQLEEAEIWLKKIDLKMQELYSISRIGWGNNASDMTKRVTFTDLYGQTRREIAGVFRDELEGERRNTYARKKRLNERQSYDLWYKNPWIIQKEKLLEEYREKKRDTVYLYDKKINPIKEEIYQLKKHVQKEVHITLPALNTVRKELEQVLLVLIAEPLAADNASFSSGEIATTLQKQPNRHAYVKGASIIYQMITRDLTATFTPVPWKEADERRNTIIKQTKDKYCRGRATVEQEIAAVYQIEEPEQKTNGDESPPPAPTKVPKKTSRKENEGVKPRQSDLFDRLDADESAP